MHIIDICIYLLYLQQNCLKGWQEARQESCDIEEMSAKRKKINNLQNKDRRQKKKKELTPQTTTMKMKKISEWIKKQQKSKPVQQIQQYKNKNVTYSFLFLNFAHFCGFLKNV